MSGGSYLATSPNISYKKLLNGLREKNFAIHAWSYVPGFDHQAQANEAWKKLRECRIKLESRIGKESFSPIRIGHSLGCKLHLISPDGGRKSRRFVGLSFNNYKADQSIPILGRVKRKLNIQTEFSPSPSQTMSMVRKNYIQANNLLIRFENDRIDQSSLLLDQLKRRTNDNSKLITLDGNHLSPAGYDFKELLFEGIDENKTYKSQSMKKLIDTIFKYAIE